MLPPDAVGRAHALGGRMRHQIARKLVADPLEPTWHTMGKTFAAIKAGIREAVGTATPPNQCTSNYQPIHLYTTHAAGTSWSSKSPWGRSRARPCGSCHGVYGTPRRTTSRPSTTRTSPCTACARCTGCTTSNRSWRPCHSWLFDWVWGGVSPW